jgi:hypothetical protein
MAELVDAPDLKSGAGNGVPVQFRLPAPSYSWRVAATPTLPAFFLRDAAHQPIVVIFTAKSFGPLRKHKIRLSSNLIRNGVAQDG